MPGIDQHNAQCPLTHDSRQALCNDLSKRAPLGRGFAVIFPKRYLLYILDTFRYGKKLSVFLGCNHSHKCIVGSRAKIDIVCFHLNLERKMIHNLNF